jgi:hypothetical protein
MSLAAKKFQDGEFLFITAGGFDGEAKTKIKLFLFHVDVLEIMT